MTEKELLFNHCMSHVQQRLDRIRFEIEQIQTSANEETKSTAGDKYETGRAMAQLEIERNLTQLKDAERLKAILNSLIPVKPSDNIRPGSLVRASKDNILVAISLGPVEIQGKKYFVVSADSPIGKLLLGKKAGDSFEWNGTKQTIQGVE